MNYILKNERLTVTLSDHGAELISVKKGDCEYIWQGDKAYWDGQAPILFPICGRLFEQTCTYDGKTYRMGTHGFARTSDYCVKKVTDSEIVFRLEANDETRAVYPFDFALEIGYRLENATLLTTATIYNTGSEILPATFGGHPGFNVPLGGDGCFSDFYLEFGEECSPDEIMMTPTCFLTGKRQAYPLVDGKRLPLSHDLFNIDAIFLSRVADSVTLRSDKTDRAVTLRYPDMPYLGIWHAPRTDAPYVCIEPWCGLPAFDQTIEDLATKPDMFRICPNSKKSVQFSIEFE